jgi:ATP-dependent protease ClpP protease subunit
MVAWDYPIKGEREKSMKMFAMLLALLPAFAMAAPAKDAVLLNKDTIVLRGEVNGESVGKVMTQILTSDADKITMYLSSPGGSVFDGLQLISTMKASGKHFTCATDFSASMSFAILQACDDRVVMSNSVTMQHFASFGIPPQPENKVDSFLGMIKSALDVLESGQAKRIGKSVAEFKKDVRDDLWLYGAQAVKYGAADRVAPVLCDAAAAKATHTEEVTILIFKLKVTWSQCPMITQPLKVEPMAGHSPKAEEVFYKRFVNFRNAEGVIRQ